MIGRLVPKGTDNGDSAGDLEGNVGETKGSGDGTDDTEGNVAPGEGVDAMTGDGLGLGASTGDGAEVAEGAILFVWACIFSAPADEEGIGAGATGGGGTFTLSI
ncbi:unnamed protein product [Sphenostylis stenocarpa]|uniref:Uncharacterized protein n=1 Tax=Sphenostylis stenocarpa TaxID=92480 RepID=A0AA86VHN6_9FABA|nr:unnamed protein product [Sphenostylis stenocarpa]